MIDARPQTGTAPDEQTEMRYPTRASELDHRRLQVPPSLLHDSSTNQLHAGAWRTSQSCVRCLTKDIRETGRQGGRPWRVLRVSCVGLPMSAPAAAFLEISRDGSFAWQGNSCTVTVDLPARRVAAT